MRLSDHLGHLTYSTLVHPGDTWPEMRDSVTEHLPVVKKRVSPDAPLGLSLRLSGSSVDTLRADPDARAQFAETLRAQELYVYTVNAFPHGPFKGQSVMEQVYEPDWATQERLRYTTGVADILAEISLPGVEPSIQTAPLAFKPNVAGPAYVDGFTHNLLRVVAHLVELERRTGRRVKLALEPEPYCFLETTEETISYFEERLFSESGVAELAKLTGASIAESMGDVRRHLGIVFDIGHQSVEFEDAATALQQLVSAGVPIFKLQEAAALWVPEVDGDAVEALGQFTETIYLSQTTELRDGKLTRFLNLGDAIEAWKAAPGGRREWRTHFHVPVFLDEIGGFRTTRYNIEAALAMHRATPLSDHLEIETYTWDVLPEHLKTGDIDEYVSREIEWVRGVLTAPQ